MNKFTVKNERCVEIEIKKSKFLAFSFFVKTKNEATEIIKNHKEKYKDATHNCFGYIIKQNQEEGFSDDKEPSKTAGYPILEYLKKNHYEYVLVIVTRYFGGTLLGTGGLLRAYREATKLVLEKSLKALVDEGYICKFKIEYKNEGIIRNLLEKENIKIKNINYLEDLEFEIILFKNEVKQIKKLINKKLGKEINYVLEKEIVRK